MSNNVLVTGGAGYIGSVLVAELLKAGYNVTVIDNIMYRQTSLLDCCHNKRLTFYRGDCRDPRVWDQVVRSADVIIPLAAIVGAPACDRDPDLATSTNCIAIVNLIKVLDGQLLLYPTTNSGYGIGEAGKFCTEDTPLTPISAYGRSKAAAEFNVLKYKNAASFRLATVFGASPRMRLDLLVNDLVYRALNDRSVTLFEGNAKRNYVHVRDVARLFLFALDNPGKFVGHPTNVGLDDANLSKIELCRQIQKHLPGFVFHTSEIGEDPDKRDYVVSNARLAATGFRTNYTLDDGIDELIKCYQIITTNHYTNYR